jgi:hypothetical protein
MGIAEQLRFANMDDEIKIINKIIAISIEHGGDPGGPYFTEHERLYEAIYDWLKYNHLENEYCIVGGGTFDDEFEYDGVPKIVPVFKHNSTLPKIVPKENPPVNMDDNIRTQDELNILIEESLDSIIEEEKE